MIYPADEIFPPVHKLDDFMLIPYKTSQIVKILSNNQLIILDSVSLIPDPYE
jgi:hypothetical protein